MLRVRIVNQDRREDSILITAEMYDDADPGKTLASVQQIVTPDMEPSAVVLALEKELNEKRERSQRLDTLQSKFQGLDLDLKTKNALKQFLGM